jgi:hypothetical protein
VREHYPELSGNDFANMMLPSLVVTGDRDFTEYFSERKDWRADAYRLSPGPKSLLTLFGAAHIFGGISGYDAKEASDENPALVAAIQRITWAYLRSGLYPEDQAWRVVVGEIESGTNPPGTIAHKPSRRPSHKADATCLPTVRCQRPCHRD